MGESGTAAEATRRYVTSVLAKMGMERRTQAAVHVATTAPRQDRIGT